MFDTIDDLHCSVSWYTYTTSNMFVPFQHKEGLPSLC